MYNPNIPQPNQLLSTSQGDILTNFNSSNNVYGVDHYAFDDTTPNATFHRQVTNPNRGSHPSSPLTNPTIYGYQDIASVGLIQYSKGPDRLDQGNQVSTPLTSIQSSQTPIVLNKGSPNPLDGQTTNVLNFTGITRAFAVLTMGNFSSSSAGLYVNSATIVYSGSASSFKIQALDQSGNPNLIATSSSNILIIKNATGNNLNNVCWTLQFLRIEI